jgi:hypothetical protein
VHDAGENIDRLTVAERLRPRNEHAQDAHHSETARAGLPAASSR